MNTAPLFRARGLHARVGGKEILRGLDLELRPGELHVLMGPNGSGKSTLAALLAGRDDVEAQAGTAELAGQDLLSLEPEARAALGLFLAFQYPVEIPGLSNTTFLREIVNAKREREGEAPLDPMSFLRRLREEMARLSMDEALAKRALNSGFSGGEKKRNEVLQLALMAPRLAVLDETDSGLDIDALRLVAEAVNRLRSPERGFLVITHYRRLLEALDPPPDRVHIFAEGRILQSGGMELADQLEAEGYESLVGAGGAGAAGAAGSAAEAAHKNAGAAAP